MQFELSAILTRRPKEKTSEDFPTLLPSCPSGLRHMTFPILWLSSFSPFDFKAQSMSPKTTFSKWNSSLESTYQFRKILLGFTSTVKLAKSLSTQGYAGCFVPKWIQSFTCISASVSPTAFSIFFLAFNGRGGYFSTKASKSVLKYSYTRMLSSSSLSKRLRRRGWLLSSARNSCRCSRMDSETSFTTYGVLSHLEK